jgi:DNA repair protein SbcC/Rad50
MIPIKLKIEGFLSYRQPVVLDFSSFSLACISGENGAGKSALLDAITWALFGVARKRDESVINNHPEVNAAQVTLDFDYEGNRYRVQRVNPRGKTSAVEFFIWSTAGDGDEGRWKPLTERTLRETDKKIEDTLRMDFDTFTNASFFLQGKADQFATARPADRKRILSNILGLEIWESYREAASLRRRDLEKDLRVLDGRLSEIQVELDEGPERVERLEALQARLANLAEQRKSQAKILENVQRLHVLLQEQRKLVDSLKLQFESAQRDLARIADTLKQRKEERTGHLAILAEADQIEAAYQAWQRARAALSSMEELAQAYHQHEALRQEPLRRIHAEAARLQQERQSLESQKQDLESALEGREGLEAQLDSAEEAIETAQGKISRRDQLDEEIRQLQARYAEAKAENPRLKDEGLKLGTRIEQLRSAGSAECPVCQKPLSNEDREQLVEVLTAELETMRARYRDNSDLVKNFESELKKMGSQLADLKNSEGELREANRKVDQIKNKLIGLADQEKIWNEKGLPRLKEIIQILDEETYAQDARRQLEGIKADLEALGYDLDAHEKLRQTEKEGRQAEEARVKVHQARAALAPIEREIADLEGQKIEKEKELENRTTAFSEAVAKLAASEAGLPDLVQAESDLFDIQEQENILRQEVGVAEGRVRILAVQEERKNALLEEREGMTQKIADLRQLERAFGKDGIPALLIEQALPEIEETTNTLLSRLSNGRMSFNFVTQREYKDASREDRKETLDMVISDNVGERDYEMFSGGEAFRVNFSIRLALSQVLARRAGARLQTLVVDEGFGSQDAQGRQRLVEAINLVKDDFEKILVITHLDELKEAFPTRIEVEKTAEGSQLRVM